MPIPVRTIRGPVGRGPLAQHFQVGRRHDGEAGKGTVGRRGAGGAKRDRALPDQFEENQHDPKRAGFRIHSRPLPSTRHYPRVLERRDHAHRSGDDVEATIAIQIAQSAVTRCVG